MEMNVDVLMASLAVTERLTLLTVEGKLSWERVGPRQARLGHSGVEYILDYSRNKSMLFIDGALILEGLILDKLRYAINGKLGLATEDECTPEPADYRAPEVLAKALEGLSHIKE